MASVPPIPALSIGSEPQWRTRWDRLVPRKQRLGRTRVESALGPTLACCGLGNTWRCCGSAHVRPRAWPRRQNNALRPLRLIALSSRQIQHGGRMANPQADRARNARNHPPCEGAGHRSRETLSPPGSSRTGVPVYTAAYPSCALRCTVRRGPCSSPCAAVFTCLRVPAVVAPGGPDRRR